MVATYTAYIDVVETFEKLLLYSVGNKSPSSKPGKNLHVFDFLQFWCPYFSDGLWEEKEAYCNFFYKSEHIGLLYSL